MKKVFLALAVVLLTGCDSTYADKTANWTLPPELSDCKVYRLDNGLSYIYAVACPGRASISQVQPRGKSMAHSAVIYDSQVEPLDGEEFQSNMTHYEFHERCMDPSGSSSDCTRAEEIFHQNLHVDMDGSR